MTNGIDVSRYQAKTPDLAALDFLFARATYGTYADPAYTMHIANARKAGLVTGAYHFGVGRNPIEQAAAFLAAAGTVDLYVLDLEKNGHQLSMTRSEARAFIGYLHARGHKVGLYASESGFPTLGQDYNWVANWSRVPAIPWTFWQYRGSPLDLDMFNGSRAKLRAFAVGVPHPTPPVRNRVSIKGDFGLYTVTGGRITSSRVAHTGGFTAACSAPHRYPWTGHSSQMLVRLLEGPTLVRGSYVRSRWMVP